MHYHLEVILPPTQDVQGALDQILAPFNEQGEDEDGDPNRHGFWDFWVIGGRWSGAKIEQGLDAEKRAAFFKTLAERKFTVSGLKCGKDRLEPPDQAEAVDAIWRESFPDSPLKACPFFAHFNDQYKHSDDFPDVMRLGDVPRNLKASRVIVAGPSWSDETRLQAKHMAQESFWNGVSHLDVKWDGTLSSVLEDYERHLSHARRDYAEKYRPGGDWLAVTVDYHS